VHLDGRHRALVYEGAEDGLFLVQLKSLRSAVALSWPGWRVRTTAQSPSRVGLSWLGGLQCVECLNSLPDLMRDHAWAAADQVQVNAQLG